MIRPANDAIAEDAEAPLHCVLVVEDEVLIRLTLAEYLRSCGLRVIEAGNGAEAVQVLTKSDVPIDLVFSDVQMPEMDGFELAQWVRANRPGLPVILTSGDGAMAKRAHELCVDGPLEKKPYDFSLLFERLKTTLSRVANLSAGAGGATDVAPGG